MVDEFWSLLKCYVASGRDAPFHLWLLCRQWNYWPSKLETVRLMALRPLIWMAEKEENLRLIKWLTIKSLEMYFENEKNGKGDKE